MLFECLSQTSSHLESFVQVMSDWRTLGAMENPRRGESTASLHVALKLGGRNYACKVQNVQEIVRRPQLEPSLDGSDLLVGMFSSTRCEIPVVDLLGRSPDEFTLHEMALVVFQVEGEVLGLLVDDLEEIVELDTSQIVPVTADEAVETGNAVSGIVMREGTEFYLLNLERIACACKDTAVKLSTERSTDNLKK